MILQKYKRNIRLFYVTAILNGLVGIFAPFIVIFQMKEIGLSLGEVMLAEGLFALTVMLCEIPSGIWADKFSRKNVLLFAAFMFSAGVFLFAFSQSLWHVILGQVVMGVGLSARSGADQALIYDSLKALKQSHRYQNILSHFRSFEFGTAIFATIAGGYIATFMGLRAPIFASACVLSCVGITWLYLTDPPIEKLRQRSTFLDYGKKGFELISQTPFLLWLIVFTAIGSMGLKINFHTLNPYWEEHGVPLLWFGYALAAYNGLAMITTLLIPKMQQIFGGIKAMALIWMVVSFGFIVMAFVTFGPMGAVIFPIVFQIGRALMRVIPSDLLQKQTNSDTRATIISMHSFVLTLSQTIFLWLFGIISDVGDLFIAFAVLGAFIFVFGGLAFFKLLKEHNLNIE